MSELSSSYDGQYVFTAGGDDCTVNMWAVNTQWVQFLNLTSYVAIASENIILLLYNTELLSHCRCLAVRIWSRSMPCWTEEDKENSLLSLRNTSTMLRSKGEIKNDDNYIIYSMKVPVIMASSLQPRTRHSGYTAHLHTYSCGADSFCHESYRILSFRTRGI